jgi:dihydrofolate reductase
MTVTTFQMIVAHDEARGIGKEGDLAWRLPGDMAYFVSVTTDHAANKNENIVIMGRRTWDSIPPRYRPLDHRKNIVLTRQAQLDVPPGVGVVASLTEGLELASEWASDATVFVIGGGMIYEEGLRHPGCRKLYITEVEGQFECDTFFPAYLDSFELHSVSDRQEDAGVGYRYCVFKRKSSGGASVGGLE